MESADRSAQYVDANGVIDVKKLIAAYSFEEHALRADRYFHTINDPWAHHLRKPFSKSDEARSILAGLASVLHLVGLQPGHHVVDFGCGTGWLSAALSMLQCRVTGIDISQRALDIAQAAVADHPYLRKQQIAFRRLEGASIPVETSTVDRIICFDSFHHVADQEFYLREFFRILRPGGVVGFSEPGPNHSRSAASQYEMRNYAVIENDIVVEEILAMSRQIGFADMTMALFTDTPITMGPEQFSSMIRAAEGVEDGVEKAGLRTGGLLTRLLAAIRNDDRAVYTDLGLKFFSQARTKCVFALRKPGVQIVDSRTTKALAADLKAVAQRFAPDTRQFTLSLLATNTGAGAWLPSGSESGAVNAGVKILTPDGGPMTREPIRFPLTDKVVASGESLNADLVIDLAEFPGDLVLEVDLVAEHVSWFSQVGSAQLRFPLSAD